LAYECFELVVAKEAELEGEVLPDEESRVFYGIVLVGKRRGN
jgi:hypothetical protein